MTLSSERVKSVWSFLVSQTKRETGPEKFCTLILKKVMLSYQRDAQRERVSERMGSIWCCFSKAISQDWPGY
jgi:hypothetical protein